MRRDNHTSNYVLLLYARGGVTLVLVLFKMSVGSVHISVHSMHV